MLHHNRNLFGGNGTGQWNSIRDYLHSCVFQIELHSPENVPIYDATLIDLHEELDAIRVYTVVETL